MNLFSSVTFMFTVVSVQLLLFFPVAAAIAAVLISVWIEIYVPGS